MIPPMWAKRLWEYGDIETGHAILAMLAVVDPTLPDKAFRILALIAGFSWKRPCPLTYKEIAEAAHCSRVQAIREVSMLERLEYIDVTRRRNCCNLYRALKREGVAVKVGGGGFRMPPRTMLTCPQCKGQRPMLLKAGWCRSCNWKLRVREVVREEMKAIG